MPQQHDNFRQNQFRYAARVRERGIKYWDAAFGGRIEIDLVGADAETTYAYQSARAGENLRR
jgi:hypothetical protein